MKKSPVLKLNQVVQQHILIIKMQHIVFLSLIKQEQIKI